MNLSASIRARLWRLSQRKLISCYRTKLAAIVALRAASTDQMIIFPPGLDWQSQLFQRPQHLALALAQQGALVFYVEPEENRNPAGFRQAAENLYLCHVPLAAFDDFAELWVHSFTWNYKYIRFFRQPRVIYDFVDDLATFEGARVMLERSHADLLHRAFVVLVTAECLLEQVRDWRPDAILCPNGVDVAHFAPASHPIPVDMQEILTHDDPIAGYYGAFARWFNYDLLAQVAEAKPDWQFVLIGPDHDRSLTTSRLLRRKNIFWLGQKPYAELPAYLACFDVAMIPFVVNDLTHATSPLKLFEYMAGGKPVVVTPMQESMRYDGVLVASSPKEFGEKLDQALRMKSDAIYQLLLKETVQANTWEARARQILSHLQQSVS